MKVDIQDTGPCQKKIKIEIPEDTVKEKLDKSYQELNAMVALPGFRKGKVPRRILEKRFGSQVVEQVQRELIEESLEKIIEEESFKLVEKPEVNLNEVKLEKSRPFSFETLIEVYPDFDLPAYKGLKVQKPKYKISEKDVEAPLNRAFQATNTKLVVVEDGKIEEKDTPIVELSVTVGDQKILAKDEAIAHIGSDTIEDIKIEGLSKKLLGKKVGDLVEFEQVLSEDFPQKDDQGKEAHFTIKILEIKRPKFKAPCEEWAKENDYESLEEIKEEIRKNLEAELESEAAKELRRNIENALLDRVDFPIPPKMVDQNAKRQEYFQSFMLKYQGMDDKEIENFLEKHREETKKSAEDNVRLYFLLDKIGKEEKIFVTENEVDQKIQELAAEERRDPEEYKMKLLEEGRLPLIRNELREKKTLDFLIQHAEIEEVEKVLGEEHVHEPGCAHEEESEERAAVGDVEEKQKKDKS